MFTPTNNLIRFMTTVIMALLLAACSGDITVAGGGGGGGIVGTGKQVVVSGEVSGLGGIVVNGIEFTRSTEPGVSATPIVLAFDNVSSAGEHLLRPGMMVAVSGSYDSVTSKGSYSRIVFTPELRGPLDTGSVNTAAGTLSVLGRTVRTGMATIFDGITDLNELLVRQGEKLELEVSGFLDAAGAVQASRIALKSSGFSSGTVQVKGLPSNVGGTSFGLGALTIPIAGATFVNMSAADLTVAALTVEVRGTLAGTGISNARIERKSASGGVKAGESINIKGFAAGTPIAGSFVLSGPDGPLLITTPGASYFRGSTPADAGIVVSGARLEVEGTVQADGSLAARRVYVETEKSVRLEGDLTTVQAATGSMTINGVTTTTTALTGYRDKRTSPVANLTIFGLATGDHLQVYGFIDGTGRIIASQVERFNAGSTAIIQGPVTALDISKSQLTVLGVSIQPQTGAQLSRGSTLYADFGTFAAQVAPGSTVIKAKGVASGTGFSAASIEIQP